MLMKSVGERLKELRDKNGLSQEELAALTSEISHRGISRQSISSWESGKSTPRSDNLSAVATALGVDVATLLDGTDTKNAPSPKEERVQRRIDTNLIEIPVISREWTACCGNGLPTMEITNEAEEYVYVPKSDFRAFDDLRQPFAIYADGDCLTSDEIHPNDKIVINPAEEPQNGVIVLASLNGVLMLKRFYQLKDGSVVLCSDEGELKLSPEQQELSDFYVVGVMASQVRGRRPARPYISSPDESRA